MPIAKNARRTGCAMAIRWFWWDTATYLRRRVRRDRADPFGGAVGFDVRTAAGNTAHVLGDPNMDPKTRAALEQIIDAAHRAIEDGTIGSEEERS